MAGLPSPPAHLLAGAALFLDFDGTLVELAETPDSIRVEPGLAPLLERIRAQLGGRLAIVSGRSLDDLERHVPLSGIAFSGSHGLELRLPGGTRLPLSIPIGFDEVRREARGIAAAADGLLVEDKPAGVAIHYRRAPEMAAQVQ
ncbi:MAG: trehalose-phosphatase, partial [Sphingosinicella sp.]